MDFIAIDFETANPKQYPCSLGLTLVKNDKITNCLSSLINPEGNFSERNIKINGITPNMVKDSPTFPQVWNKVSSLFNHYPVVAHNASFDGHVLESTAKRYGIELPNITYLCTMRLCEINYPDMPQFHLNDVCNYLGIELEHHHCCSDDSLAAAKIMIKLSQDLSASIFPYGYFTAPKVTHRTVTPPEEKKINKYFYPFKGDPIYKDPDVEFDDGDIEISGNSFCLTGQIGDLSRQELVDTSTSLGGEYNNSVIKKTNYLVAGMEDINLVADTEHAKSGKIKKAELLKSKGSDIKIISADEFIKALERCECNDQSDKLA